MHVSLLPYLPISVSYMRKHEIKTTMMMFVLIVSCSIMLMFRSTRIILRTFDPPTYPPPHLKPNMMHIYTVQ